MKVMNIKSLLIVMSALLMFSLNACNDEGKTGASSLDTLLITVPDDISPIAVAGLDQTVIKGDIVILDGSGSSDEDGEIVSYLWQLLDGTQLGTLAKLELPTASLEVGTYEVVLIVTDDRGATGVDTVMVTLNNPAPPAPKPTPPAPKPTPPAPPAPPAPTPTPPEPSLCSITGTITDATNGNALAGVALNVREDHDTPVGPVYLTEASDGEGHYLLEDIAEGNYTIEAIEDGYITGFLNVTCMEDETVENQNISLSPVLEEGETRIVLTWGPLPTDLDSHLKGPDGSGGTFHVYYSNKIAGGSELDTDDTSSFGPETITIYTQNDGEYIYYVKNYSGDGGGKIKDSDAKVEVYRGSSLIKTYNVPQEEGEIWSVFTLNGTVITDINTVSYVEP